MLVNSKNSCEEAEPGLLRALDSDARRRQARRRVWGGEWLAPRNRKLIMLTPKLIMLTRKPIVLTSSESSLHNEWSWIMIKWQ